jgi:cytochrome c-type biogenesis protein CcsB
MIRVISSGVSSRGVGVPPTPQWLCRIVISFVLCVLMAGRANALNVDPLRDLPVLDNGRIKPLDTQARQLVRFVTGGEKFDGLDPLELLLRWQAAPEVWEARPILHVPNLALREKVGIKEGQHVSPAVLRANAAYAEWVNGLKARQQKADKLGEEVAFDRTEQAGLDLDHRLVAFGAAREGRVLAIVPISDDEWLRVAELGVVDPSLPDTSAVKSAWQGVVTAAAAQNDAQLAAAAVRLKASINDLKPRYAPAARIEREVAYNRVHPFRWTWIAYGLSLLGLIASNMIGRRWAYLGAIAVFVGAMLLHVGSFAWRCSVTGWAPVTNMYETVVWVSLMAAVFALGIELFYRNATVAIAGAAAATIGGIIADVMPPSLGHDIGSLAPVLRSNYWLTIHVLTIVSSYAAFVLAAVLGNVALTQFILKRRSERGGGGGGARGGPRRGENWAAATAGETPTPLNYAPHFVRSLPTTLTFTYRAIQIGVLLLAAGTILGGLWADQSWGRFWGWDPKEVWALIALLTYLALLHGRFAGWIGQFGLAAGAVLCFSTVLMSWYGVNFVLGVGLHSYGFGVGGQAEVGSFVVLQIIYVIVARLLVGRTRAQQTQTQETESQLPVPQPTA